MLVTVTDKGQLTVPKTIRDQFGIEPGSKLDFEPQADGTLRVRVLTRGAGNLFGLLQRTGARAKTVEEMDAGIAEAVAARTKRSKA
jgi:AbrB family looped-hinge helix DNA binding protein